MYHKERSQEILLLIQVPIISPIFSLKNGQEFYNPSLIILLNSSLVFFCCVMFLLVFATGVCLIISKCILFTYAKNFQDSLKPRMKVFPSRKHLCLLLPKTSENHQVLRSSSQLKVDKVRLSEVKVTQSCSTLCDPTDYTVRGILQARILEWVAIPFSRGSSQPRDRTRVALNVGGFFTS